MRKRISIFLFLFNASAFSAIATASEPINLDSVMRVYPKMICSTSDAGMDTCLGTVRRYVGYRYIGAHSDYFTQLLDKMLASKMQGKQFSENELIDLRRPFLFLIARDVGFYWEANGDLPDDPRKIPLGESPPTN